MTFEEFSLIERLGDQALKTATQVDKLIRGKANTASESVDGLCRVGTLIADRNSSTSTHCAVMLLVAVSQNIVGTQHPPEVIKNPRTVMAALQKSMKLITEANDKTQQTGLRDYLLELSSLCRDRLDAVREAEANAMKPVSTVGISR